MPRVTLTTIARETGVSKNTVSLALRHDPQIPPATRERILRVAQRLGYVRNPVVAELMSELRRRGRGDYRRTLALVNANADRQAFARHPTLPTYVAGCRRRAAFHGYRLDEFWLHDPELYGERLHRILHARGIRGIVLVGLMHDNHLPARFASLWPRHPCVATGARTRSPTLSYCCVDHHALVLEAVEQALKLGYRRPALVVDAVIDRLVDGRFGAGMWAGQTSLPPEDRSEAFTRVEEARTDPSLFRDWFEKNRPDVILTLYTRVRTWLEAMGRRVPRDVGLIQLELRPDTPDWAGMDQHNDLTGEAAVDMLVELVHRQETGVPDFPRATLMGPSWVPGATVRKRHD